MLVVMVMVTTTTIYKIRNMRINVLEKEDQINFTVKLNRQPSWSGKENEL